MRRYTPKDLKYKHYRFDIFTDYPNSKEILSSGSFTAEGIDKARVRIVKELSRGNANMPKKTYLYDSDSREFLGSMYFNYRGYPIWELGNQVWMCSYKTGKIHSKDVVMR